MLISYFCYQRVVPRLHEITRALSSRSLKWNIPNCHISSFLSLSVSLCLSLSLSVSLSLSLSLFSTILSVCVAVGSVLPRSVFYCDFLAVILY